jgi:LacI family transcriptional regulator
MTRASGQPVQLYSQRRVCYSAPVSITLKDVAREAQVSMATVSRALNGTGAVTEEIRARVLQVAARLNYVPNIGAQSLMTRRTNMIGVLLQTFHGEFFSELLRGIDAAARARKLHLLVSSAHNDTAETGATLRAMIGRVDGLLVLLPHVDGKFLQESVRSALPVVLMSTADAEHAYASVYVDNYGGACAMVKHLAELGHRSIAHIAGRPENMDTEERLRGYRDALAKELPGSPEIVLQGDFTEESGYKAAQDLLAYAVKPNAIFAANDMMAIGCMSALLEAGLRVPQDIAVVGFDDIPTARFVRPRLTTVSVKIADLGGRALDRLADAIENPEVIEPVCETVPAELVIRASCGARVFP